MGFFPELDFSLLCPSPLPWSLCKPPPNPAPALTSAQSPDPSLLLCGSVESSGTVGRRMSAAPSPLSPAQKCPRPWRKAPWAAALPVPAPAAGDIQCPDTLGCSTNPWWPQAGWEGTVPTHCYFASSRPRAAGIQINLLNASQNLSQVPRATLGCHFLWRHLSTHSSWGHLQKQSCSKTAIQELGTQSLLPIDRCEDFERESLLWEQAAHPAGGMSPITIS